MREALSDLPQEISPDDGPLPYPSKPWNSYSDYQKLTRLDCDQPLLSAQQKRRRLQKDELFNHRTKGIQERRKAILVAIKPGARGDSLPKELWNGTRGHKWRRLDPDKPSYTILAQMHRDLSERIHPSYDRWITVREAARLQSFHDGFVARDEVDAKSLTRELIDSIIGAFVKARRSPSSSGCAIGSIRAAISAISTGLRTTKARARHERSRALQLDALAATLPMDQRDRLERLLSDDDSAKRRQTSSTIRRCASACASMYPQGGRERCVQPEAARPSATRRRRRSSWRRW